MQLQSLLPQSPGVVQLQPAGQGSPCVLADVRVITRCREDFRTLSLPAMNARR